MSKQRMKLAISPIIWSNDDMRDLGAETGFEQCLNEMVMAGYQGCEMGHKFPRDDSTLKDHLRKRGLQVCNKWFDFRLTNDSVESNLVRLQHHINLLRSLNCRVVGGGEVGNAVYPDPDCPLSKRPRLNSKEAWKEFGSRLNACGRLANESQMQLAFHPHMGTVVQDESDIKRLLEVTDPEYVFINYDSGHCAFAGDDPLSVLRTCDRRIGHVHLKNIRPAVYNQSMTEDWSFFRSVREGVFTIPGDEDGGIDFSEIIEDLVRINYKGWLVVEAEQDPDRAPPLLNARKAFLHLQELLDKYDKD